MSGMCEVQKIYAVWIYVKDFKESRDFYEGILGLKPGYKEGEWLEYDLGETKLAILQREPEQGSLKPQKMRTMLQVDDIASMKERLLEHNVKLVGDIRDEGYGKLLTFEDPNGHWLELFEPAS